MLRAPRAQSSIATSCGKAPIARQHRRRNARGGACSAINEPAPAATPSAPAPAAWRYSPRSAAWVDMTSRLRDLRFAARYGFDWFISARLKPELLEDVGKRALGTLRIAFG